MDNWIFSPQQNLKYYKNLIRSNELESWTSNKNWSSYRLNIFKEYILILYFENEEIKMIDIFPTNGKDGDIATLLKKLGSEYVYSWGKVELNIDIKAGYQSVIVKYN